MPVWSMLNARTSAVSIDQMRELLRSALTNLTKFRIGDGIETRPPRSFKHLKRIAQRRSLDGIDEERHRFEAEKTRRWCEEEFLNAKVD